MRRGMDRLFWNPTVGFPPWDPEICVGVATVVSHAHASLMVYHIPSVWPKIGFFLAPGSTPLTYKKSTFFDFFSIF